MTDSSTQEYYNERAAEYASLTQEARLPHLWNLITDRLPPGATILDLGCGAGRDLRYFSEAGYRPVGIDLSLPLVDIAREFSGQEVIHGDFCHSSLAENSFDAVWAVGSLVHVTRDSISEILTNIYGFLRPHGIFLASVKAGSGEHVDRNGRHFTYYQPSEWGALLANACFDIDLIETTTEGRPPDYDVREVKWLVSVCTKAQSVIPTHGSTTTGN